MDYQVGGVFLNDSAGQQYATPAGYVQSSSNSGPGTVLLEWEHDATCDLLISWEHDATCDLLISWAHDATTTRLIAWAHDASWTVLQSLEWAHDAIVTVLPEHLLEWSHDATVTRLLSWAHDATVTVIASTLLEWSHDATVTVIASTLLEWSHDATVTVIASTLLEWSHDATVTVIASTLLEWSHDAIVTVLPAHLLEWSHDAIVTVLAPVPLEWEHDATVTVIASTVLEWSHDAIVTVLPAHLLEWSHDAIVTVLAPVPLEWEHAAAWTVLQPLEWSHDATVTVIFPLEWEHDATWTVIDHALLEWSHDATVTVIDLSPVFSAPSHSLRVGVELIPFVRARIRADEGSPYWQCEQLELQRPSDYRKLPRDTPFSLNLFGVDYAFVVDTRELSRTIDADGNPSQVATITGLSPGCRLVGPRATAITRTWSEPASARAIVEELLGETVAWSMVDWWIPGGRLAVDGAYPLDIARRIVEAAGGLLESAPDGSWLARPAWPVSVPNLRPDGPVDHALDDRIVFDVKERPSLEQRVNRIRIVDIEADYRDTLEWVADDDDPLQGELRAFPSPWRQGLSIRHTRGTPPVYLDGVLESATAEQTEIIEFKSGLASVRYPVLTVQSVTWLAESLGGVAASGTQLTAAVAGYSLAEVVYITRYLRAPAHASEAAQAQFLLEDACLV